MITLSRSHCLTSPSPEYKILIANSISVVKPRAEVKRTIIDSLTKDCSPYPLTALCLMVKEISTFSLAPVLFSYKFKK